MLKIKNITLWTGEETELHIESDVDTLIDARGLTALPGVIDPHVHFRTPGMEYKENWMTAAKAAIYGGCTYVFDMPNTLPPTITQKYLHEKKAIIDSQLKKIGIPLRYQLFFGADKHHLSEITLIKDEVIGIKVFMGCSTGNLVIDDDESLARVFNIAAENNMLVAVHAEDEHELNRRKKHFSNQQGYSIHSQIRNIEVATKAITKAISLAERYQNRLYILHVSSNEELELIRQAKAKGLAVYAETTPHHLFLNNDYYADLGGKVVVNPPLRNKSHQEKIFDAISEGVIDTIGSDHAPHTLAEKSLAYGQCPSGMPGIEFMLPLLLNAYHQQKISLSNIVKITSQNAKKIFSLPPIDDYVLVDLEEIKTIENTQSKCGWSAYMGMRLKGWPKYTIISGNVFKLF